MADVFSKEKRSWVMSRIRGRDTGIDLAMGRMLEGMGYRFERYPRMDGSPDFILPRRRVAIFCDGDFWHGYRYREKRRPRQRYWRGKIERNMARDRRTSARLRRAGWAVLRFWGHDIERNPEKCVRRIRAKYRARSSL